ncbi:nucleotide-binding protein [Nostoc muscorum FACHB-395]|jgi:predicted nucleotide-binding protein|nr:nucleotide-binding protein [Desmonostoc muscorum FACHB-395]
MDDLRDSLDRIKSICSEIVAQFESSDVAKSIKTLQEAVNQAAKSWSGSWLGYHSRVYYNQLQPVPPGARFSQEWGLSDGFSNETRGDWCEYDFDSIYNILKSKAINFSLEQLNELANYANEEIPDLREELISIIFSCLASGEDTYLDRLKQEAELCKTSSVGEFVDYLRGGGQFFSRDRVAVLSGSQTPPHIYLQAQLLAVQSPATVAESLKKIANRLALHLTKKSRTYMYSSQPGTHIFIGHGRSLLWRDLKDFISERLKLPWDEFNRVPIAGITNTVRLSQMLDSAAIAFLIMTAEDEQSDLKLRARMNVIHEAGLFQGRLGFTRAIILLEEGCENFSNVDGLGYINFPRGNIKACFEDVRMVLEREGLV